MNRPYIVAALAIWAVWGVSWMIAGLWSARRVAAAAPGSYAWQLAIALVGYGLLFFDRLAVHPLWIVPPALGWPCVAAVAIGAALAWWARLELGPLWSMTIIRREGQRVVDTGPYALVRHPIYTAIILGAVGLATVRATPRALTGAALIALGFALKARVEERFLAAELGEASYADYRRRVPMLLPFGPVTGRG